MNTENELNQHRIKKETRSSKTQLQQRRVNDSALVPPAPRRCFNANAGTASAQSDSTDYLRTTAHRNLANALVDEVGHKHITARINGHAIGSVEAGVRTRRVDIIALSATDSARKRRNNCPPIKNTKTNITFTIIASSKPQPPTTKLRKDHLY
jgi:hypothetical protein